MTEMMKPVLDVRGLRVEIPTRHGVLTALDDINLTIAPGEIVGMVGESGAGKSMTGNAVLGLLPPPGHIAAGEIYVSGERIDNLSEKAMNAVRGRKVGAVFQDPLTGLDPLMTVGDQLTETILTHHPTMTKGAARARALALLKETGIPAAESRMDHWPHQFSGGQRQRIVIALALSGDPELLIADEPTTALDVSIQAQIMELIRKLARERQMAVLLITHDMGVIAETAHRVAVMYAGQIVEIGNVADVIHRPQHPYTLGLMGAIPDIHTKSDWLEQIDGAMPGLNAIPAGCAFHPRCRAADGRCRSERPPLMPMGTCLARCWMASPTGGPVPERLVQFERQAFRYAKSLKGEAA